MPIGWYGSHTPTGVRPLTRQALSGGVPSERQRTLPGWREVALPSTRQAGSTLCSGPRMGVFSPQVLDRETHQPASATVVTVKVLGLLLILFMFLRHLDKGER